LGRTYRAGLVIGLALQTYAVAQQLQIPTLQVCNKTVVVGDALVHIDARSDATHAGTFQVKIEASCDPALSGFPGGSLSITAVNMTDSQISGQILAAAHNIEQITSTGQATPTAYLNGTCNNQPATGERAITGCRFWLLIADNQNVAQHPRTPDVISVVVFDAQGRTVFYATGPVAKGHVGVTH
jgi:hypothetical protein